MERAAGKCRPPFVFEVSGEEGFKNYQVELFPDRLRVISIPDGPGYGEEVKPFFAEFKVEAFPGFFVAVGDKMRFRQKISVEVF